MATPRSAEIVELTLRWSHVFVSQISLALGLAEIWGLMTSRGLELVICGVTIGLIADFSWFSTVSVLCFLKRLKTISIVSQLVTQLSRPPIYAASRVFCLERSVFRSAFQTQPVFVKQLTQNPQAPVADRRLIRFLFLTGSTQNRAPSCMKSLSQLMNLHLESLVCPRVCLEPSRQVKRSLIFPQMFAALAFRAPSSPQRVARVSHRARTSSWAFM